MPDEGGATGAPLWIPVVPETSQWGPAMQDAGKKTRDEFLKGVRGVGKDFIESLRNDELGKKIGTDLVDGLNSYMQSHSVKGAGVLKDSITKAIEGKSVGKIVGEEVTKGLSDYLQNDKLNFKGAGVLKDSIADAMQGREVGEIVGNRIGEGLGDWLSRADFPGAGTIRESIIDIFNGKDAGEVVGSQIGKGIGDWLSDANFTGAGVLRESIIEAFGDGKDIGTVIGTRIGEGIVHVMPDELKDIVAQAIQNGDMTAALGDFKEALAGLGGGDLQAGLDGLAKALQDLGIDVGDLPGPAQGVVAAAQDMADAFSSAKGRVKDVSDYLETLRDLAPGIAAELEKIAGPMIEIAGAQQGVEWVQDHLPKSLQGREPTIDKDLGPNQGAGLSGRNWGHDFTHPWEIPQRMWRNFFGHERGGPLTGDGPKGKDSIFMLGAPGEHMWTADEVDAAGGHDAMYALRAMARKGMLNLPGFDKGGQIGRNATASSGPARAIAYADSMIGTPYSQALRNDCSGMVSQVVNAYLGLPPRSSMMTTRNEADWLQARGFQLGQGPPGTLRVGWYNHGSGANDGHTAMTLPDGENAESGGSHGNFLVGAGAAGADSAMFDHHAWLPPNPQGQDVGGSGGMQSSASASGGGGGTTGSGGSGGGGSAAGGASGQGGGGGMFGGGGGDGGADPKDFGRSMAQGLMQELGLDGSVFQNPINFPIPKMGESLFNTFSKMGQSQSGAGMSGMGYPGDLSLGAFGNLMPSLSSGPNMNPASQVRDERGGGSPVSVQQDNSFHVHGVGTVQEQQEQYNARNASPRSIPTTIVNGGVVPHGG